MCSGRLPPAAAARVLRGDGGPGGQKWPEESRGAARAKRRRECGTALGERQQPAGKRPRTDGPAVLPRQPGAVSCPGAQPPAGRLARCPEPPSPRAPPQVPSVTPRLPLGPSFGAGSALRAPRVPGGAPGCPRGPGGGAEPSPAASHAPCLPRRDPAAGRGGEQKRSGTAPLPFPRHTRLLSG